MSRIKNFLLDDTGLEASEYVVAGFLVTLAVITAFTSLGSAVNNKITALANYIK